MQYTITRTREDRLSMHDLVTCNGETHTIKEWANLHDIDYVTLMARMRRGCSLEDIISQGKLSETLLEYKGVKKNINTWAKEKGLKRHTVMARLKHGWSVEKALDTPPVAPKDRWLARKDK